ncbi:MAG: ATP-binding protein [Paracoccus sp. (in: a-proteobacteria)]
MKEQRNRHFSETSPPFDADRLLLAWNIRLLDLLPLPAEIMQAGASFHQLVQILHKQGIFRSGATLERIMRWVREHGMQPSLRDELSTASGHHLALAMRAMPDGGFVISFTDITSERRAQAALAETNETLEASVRRRTFEMESARDDALRANQAKTRFLAAASHDLLQPLNAAKLFLASVQPEALPPREAMLMQRVESAFSSVEAILHALLDISRLDGATDVQHSQVDLGALFASIATDYRETAARKGILLRFVPTRAVILSDPGYLQRIIQNLVVNAITYTAGGKVLFGARHLPGGKIRIEVWDTGPGIPACEREAIFEEFHRLDTGLAQAPGMGLGLSIVKRAAMLLDHQLSLDSREGHGTVFRLTVEQPQHPQAHGESRAPEALAPLPFSDMIVVLIENEPAVRDAMVVLLDQWGVSPLPASDHDGALKLIEEIDEVPDAIIADFQLDHGRSGIEAISMLRSRFGNIHALLVTADRSDELASIAHSLGISLLRKPLQPVALRSWLSRIPKTIR